MRYISLLIISICLMSCQADKKAPKTQAEKEAAQAEYDYRNSLQNYKIGINHIHAGEIQDAIMSLEKAVRGDGNNYRYRHGLGLAYSMSGQLDEAVEQLLKSREINPDFSEANNLLGTIYTDQGKYDEAIACFHLVIRDKSFSQPQFAYFNMGKVKRLQGKLDEAVAAFKLAAQMDPNFFRSYVALAEIYREKKDYAKVLHYYQKAEPNYPTDVNVLFNIGHALFRLKRYERAKSYLAQVSILSPPPDIDKPTQDMLAAIESIMRTQRN